MKITNISQPSNWLQELNYATCDWWKNNINPIIDLMHAYATNAVFCARFYHFRSHSFGIMIKKIFHSNMLIKQLINGRVLKPKFKDCYLCKPATKSMDIQESTFITWTERYFGNGAMFTFIDSLCQFGLSLCTCVFPPPDIYVKGHAEVTAYEKHLGKWLSGSQQ